MRCFGKFATLGILALAWLCEMKCTGSAVLITSLVWGMEG